MRQAATESDLPGLTRLLSQLCVAVDGQIKTKRTSRESDVADRIKLERLRNALQHKEST